MKGRWHPASFYTKRTGVDVIDTEDLKNMFRADCLERYRCDAPIIRCYLEAEDYSDPSRRFPCFRNCQ